MSTTFATTPIAGGAPGQSSTAGALASGAASSSTSSPVGPILTGPRLAAAGAGAVHKGKVVATAGLATTAAASLAAAAGAASATIKIQQGAAGGKIDAAFVLPAKLLEVQFDEAKKEEEEDAAAAVAAAAAAAATAAALKEEGGKKKDWQPSSDLDTIASIAAALDGSVGKDKAAKLQQGAQKEKENKLAGPAAPAAAAGANTGLHRVHHAAKARMKELGAINSMTLSEMPSSLAVGAQVVVAARTWPGMNKPGGAGRILRANADGTYDIKYLLGGSEKNIEGEFWKCGRIRRLG